jgi:hypothetical protein
MPTLNELFPLGNSGSTVDAIYGDTGSTKTSRLGDAAEYHYKRTGKPSRLVSSDTGGWAPIQSLVTAGVITPFALVMQRPNLIEDMDKLSQGWWPVDPDDPMSILERPKAGPPTHAALLMDGATAWCHMMMTFHEGAVEYDPNFLDKDTGAKGGYRPTTVRVPEMPRGSFVKSGEYLRRFTGRSDYGGVQARIKEFIRNTAFLPVPAVWTALETKGADEGKKPIYGPDFIGQALTGVCGPWFGNLLHLDFVPVEKLVDNPAGTGKLKIIEAAPLLFTRSHIDERDPSQTPYMAKPRVARTMWNKLDPVMLPRLDQFYERLDAIAAEEAAATKKSMDTLLSKAAT